MRSRSNRAPEAPAAARAPKRKPVGVASNTITLLLGGAVELILRPPPPEITPVVTVRYQNFSATAQGEHMAYTLPVDNLIVVKVAYVDSHGNPAAIDDEVIWATSNDTVATVKVDAGDSSICTVTAVGEIGSAQITATADADLGEGSRDLVTLLDLTVVAGEAVAGVINVVAAPQPIAPHPEQQRQR